MSPEFREKNHAEAEDSPERERYKELMAQAMRLPLEGEDMGDIDEDLEGQREPNLRDDFELSGDPEKIAMFNLFEARRKLDFYAASFRMGEDKKTKKMREDLRDVLDVTLSDVGLKTPDNAKDTKKMMEGIRGFDVWKKMKEAVIERQQEK